MKMRASLVALVLLALLAGALAHAAPVTVTITFVNAPEKLDGATAYFYSPSGLAAEAKVSGNQTSATLEGGVYYVKVTGARTTALVLVNTSASTSYVADYQGGFIGLNVTVKGFFAPVDYTVQIGGMNATVSSRYTLYAFSAPSLLVTFPEKLLFPSVFGYTLGAIILDGASVGNGFTVASTGMHNVTVEYNLSTPSPWVIALAVIIIIAVAALIARRGGARASYAADVLRSEWVE